MDLSNSNGGYTFLRPSPIIQDVTDSPFVSSPMGLQVAAQMSDYYEGLGLNHGGCAGVDTPLNCTTACKDLDRVFGSAATFQNCLAFPMITNRLSSGNASAAEIQTARDYGIEYPTANNAISDIGTPLLKCLIGYIDWCQQDQECKVIVPSIQDSCVFNLEDNPPFFLGGTFQRLSGQGAWDCIDRICSSVAAPVNADIAGIGV